jgi:hypothetical protein
MKFRDQKELTMGRRKKKDIFLCKKVGKKMYKIIIASRCQWLTTVILATQERSRFKAQENSSRDPILKKPITKKKAVDWLKI